MDVWLSRLEAIDTWLGRVELLALLPCLVGLGVVYLWTFARHMVDPDAGWPAELTIRVGLLLCVALGLGLSSHFVAKELAVVLVGVVLATKFPRVTYWVPVLGDWVKKFDKRREFYEEHWDQYCLYLRLGPVARFVCRLSPAIYGALGGDEVVASFVREENREGGHLRSSIMWPCALMVFWVQAVRFLRVELRESGGEALAWGDVATSLLIAFAILSVISWVLATAIVMILNDQAVAALSNYTVDPNHAPPPMFRGRNPVAIAAAVALVVLSVLWAQYNAAELHATYAFVTGGDEPARATPPRPRRTPTGGERRGGEVIAVVAPAQLSGTPPASGVRATEIALAHHRMFEEWCGDDRPADHPARWEVDYRDAPDRRADRVGQAEAAFASWRDRLSSCVRRHPVDTGARWIVPFGSARPVVRNYYARAAADTDACVLQLVDDMRRSELAMECCGCEDELTLEAR